jgi:hypothetical protein
MKGFRGSGVIQMAIAPCMKDGFLPQNFSSDQGKIRERAVCGTFSAAGYGRK